MDLAKIRKKIQESGGEKPEKKPAKKPDERPREKKAKPVSLKEDYPPFEEDLEDELPAIPKKAESEPAPRPRMKPKESRKKPEPVSDIQKSPEPPVLEELETLAESVGEELEPLPDFLEEAPEEPVKPLRLEEPKPEKPKPIIALDEPKTFELPEEEANPLPVTPEPRAPEGEGGEAGGETTGETIVELLTFNLAGEEYAFRVMDVEEILRPQKFATVSKTADFIIGITSLRGKIIPLMDLKKRLMLRGNTHKSLQRILILKGPKGSIGALVDKVIDVIRIPEAAMVNPPSHLAESVVKFIEAVAVSESRFVSVVRVEEALNFSITGGNS